MADAAHLHRTKGSYLVGNRTKKLFSYLVWRLHSPPLHSSDERNPGALKVGAEPDGPVPFSGPIRPERRPVAIEPS